MTTQASTPRSYIVDTQSGQLRRNRYHHNVIPENQCSPSTFETEKENQSPPRQIMTRFRTGTLIRPPERLQTSQEREMWCKLIIGLYQPCYIIIMLLCLTMRCLLLYC